MSSSTIARTVDARPGLGRLTAVELRKMTDTRAGFWLQVVIALATVAAVIIGSVTGSAEDHDLVTLLSVAVAPSSILLPVVGVLLVTSEWNQRTALVTFALVPDRWRILAAKLLAGSALALVALVFCLALSLAAVGLTPDGTYVLSAGILGQNAVSLVAGMATGVAFGAAFLASAPAIVAYFVLPTLLAALGSLSIFEGVAKWVDVTAAQAPLTEELLDGTQWARVAVSLLLWLALPLTIGGYRILRGEVK